MISGLNQDVTLLGKTFHFQTELSDQDRLTIRTEVFVGGKVVATRDAAVDDLRPDNEGALRARMKQHHQQTIQTFVLRARRYHLRVPDTDPGFEMPEAAEAPAAASPGLETPQPEPSPSAVTLGPPSTGGDQVLASAIRIRRYFGQVRRRIGPPTLEPDDLSMRLTGAAQALAWMIASPHFAEVRIDEQARCNLLKEQIDEWLISARDVMQGAQIWSGVITFSAYLAEVNDRAELLSFDQQLLVWALAEVQREGMSPQVLEHLASIYGRHARLDEMLDQPEGVADGRWTAHLRSVLTIL